MEKKTEFWVARDKEIGFLPLAFIQPAQGKMAEYVQPEIDKFLKKNPDCEVVKVELVEI